MSLSLRARRLGSPQWSTKAQPVPAPGQSVRPGPNFTVQVLNQSFQFCPSTLRLRRPFFLPPPEPASAAELSILNGPVPTPRNAQGCPAYCRLPSTVPPPPASPEPCLGLLPPRPHLTSPTPHPPPPSILPPPPPRDHFPRARHTYGARTRFTLARGSPAAHALRRQAAHRIAPITDSRDETTNVRCGWIVSRSAEP